MSELAVILPAAGRSVRFGRDKLAEPLAGRPVLLRSIDAFIDRPDVRKIVIATTDSGRDWLARQSGIAEPIRNGRIAICAGGETRAHSVRNALSILPPDIEWVAVHDAARPLVSQQLIDQTLAVAQQRGAAVPAMPVALTVKQADGPLPARVRHTLPRHTLWAMQTPQIMRRAELLAAFANCPIPFDQVTDDVQLLELIGQEVWLVPGEERNLKITTAADLKLAEMFLAQNP
jgi:2-C-methyl-D-erythritol 4-phosphate cytidylyltransferase